MASFLCNLLKIFLLQLVTICHSETIIVSTPYQYEHGTITCNGTENCTILCQAKKSCHYAKIYCPSTHSCNMHCTASNQDDYTCAFAEMYCPDNAPCDILCDGRKDNGLGFACYGATMHWPTVSPFKESYSLQCNGGNACQWISINAPSNNTQFDFQCNGFNACQYSTIHCPTDAACSIICNGTYSCDHITLNCPTHSSCSINCAGDAACNFATVNWPDYSPNTVSTLICDPGSYSNPCGNIINDPPTLSPTHSPTVSGMGCVPGNICIKTAQFAAQTPPIWWFSMHDVPLINSLQIGCSISGCGSIQLKESSQTQWATGVHLDSVGCQFNVNPALASEILSVDIRITSTSNHVLMANGVIKRLMDETEWDFGSNFVTCSLTNPPTIIPTNNPSVVPTIQPTSNPTNIPTLIPTFIPTSNPSFTPTSNPSFIPTSIPTFIPTSNPSFIPTSNPSSIPTFIPTFIPTLNTKIATINPTVNTIITSINPTVTPIISGHGEVSQSSTTYDATYDVNIHDALKLNNNNTIPMAYVVIVILITLAVILLIVFMIIYCKKRKYKKQKSDQIESQSAISSITMMVNMNSKDNNSKVRVASNSFAVNLNNLNAVNNVLMDDVVSGIDDDEICDHEMISTTGMESNGELDKIDTDFIFKLVLGELKEDEHMHDENDPEIIDLDEEQKPTMQRILSEGPKDNSTQLHGNKSKSKSASNKSKSVKFAEEYDMHMNDCSHKHKRKKKESVEELLQFNDTANYVEAEFEYQDENDDDDDSEEMFEQYQHRKKSTVGTSSEFNGEYDENDGDV